MPTPIPFPGSSRARLIAAATARFQARGFETSNVVDIAADAGVTTGSLYHHFGSKVGLYVVIRDEMERRMADRIEGAAVAAGGGRAGVAAGLRVAFDAAVRFGVSRILSEPGPPSSSDEICEAIRGANGVDPIVATCAASAWRGALAATAAGADADRARAALSWLIESRPAPGDV